MSGEYEKDLQRLQKLWNEILSDSEEEPFDGGSSDEYEPDAVSEDFSDEEIPRPKRVKR